MSETPENTPSPASEDLTEFHWLIHDTCNYHCPYCPRSGGNRAQGPRKENTRTAETWAAAWRRVHAACGRCRVYITGGEPTLFPGFIGLVGELCGMHSVVFDTNLSWSRPELELFCGQVSPRDVKVNLSFHPDTAAADEFIEKALLLRERGFGAACRVVSFPPLLPELAAYCDKFEKAGLGLAVTPFRGPYEGKKYPRQYTEEERARIASLNSRRRGETTGRHAGIMRRILYPRMVPLLGQACRSGQVYCCVEHDGTAYRCMQYANRAMEPLGSILDGDFRLAGGPSPCGLMYCEYERRHLVAFAGRGSDEESPR
jgi:MoaA/NifB/PqqE/SkfB family radical SAM enzyme